jgi:hypothetical protein
MGSSHYKPRNMRHIVQVFEYTQFHASGSQARHGTTSMSFWQQTGGDDSVLPGEVTMRGCCCNSES